MIAIKGMEMPTSCKECMLNNVNSPWFGLCRTTGNNVIEYKDSRHPSCPLVEIVTYKDSPKQAHDEYKIEQEIREELERLTTYRIPNTKTDLVSLKAIKRVLNLVFRGSRDLEPKNICDKEWLDDSN